MTGTGVVGRSKPATVRDDLSLDGTAIVTCRTAANRRFRTNIFWRGEKDS